MRYNIDMCARETWKAKDTNGRRVTQKVQPKTTKLLATRLVFILAKASRGPRKRRETRPDHYWEVNEWGQVPVSPALSPQARKRRNSLNCFGILSSSLILFSALTSCTVAPLIMHPDFAQEGEEQLLRRIIKADRQEIFSVMVPVER